MTSGGSTGHLPEWFDSEAPCWYFYRLAVFPPLLFDTFTIDSSFETDRSKQYFMNNIHLPIYSYKSKYMCTACGLLSNLFGATAHAMQKECSLRRHGQMYLGDGIS